MVDNVGTTKTQSHAYNPMDSNEHGSLPMMIHVCAPSTLPAGYTFEAEINGDPDKVFSCEVPEGGVREGQLFLAPLPENYDKPHIQAPTGRWKDGLFDFFAAGFCHASFWCALCCTQIAMGQIMSRMQLTWLGEVGSNLASQQTFKVVVILVACYYIYSSAIELTGMSLEVENTPSWLAVLEFVGDLLFSIWAVYSLCRTRENVRARYQIPEQNCQGCEDLCCSFWCGCCVTAQILRHTGEYETYPGTCCTKTGHPPGTPLVV